MSDYPAWNQTAKQIAHHRELIRMDWLVARSSAAAHATTS